jgi:opacity protein-like surface antigen
MIKNPIVRCLCVAVVAVVSHPVSAVEIASAQVAFVADSNPAKAQFDSDIESTSAARAGVTFHLHSIPIDEASSVEFDASASVEGNFDITELGESVYVVGVEFFREHADLPAEPLFALRGELGYTDSETDIRDAAMLALSASGNWQPMPFFDFTAGARIDVRQASTEVFDTTKGQLFATANFSPAERVTLRSGLSFVFGDEVSTATPTLAIVNTATAIEPDNAFGGFDERRFAYLLDATSVIVQLGANIAVSPQISADIGYRYVHTEADEDISYDRNLVTISARYAF